MYAVGAAIAGLQRMRLAFLASPVGPLRGLLEAKGASGNGDCGWLRAP